jgi:AcrR family transcriptional regulator
MDDVANAAGVGKGTLYLHWKTRQALFQAVLEREIVALLGELMQAVERDPHNALPDRLGAVYFAAVMQRPLVRAIFQMDRDVLGTLVQQQQRRDPQFGGLRVELMRFLQQLGLLRQDLSAEELAYVFRTLLLGFFMADPIVSDNEPNAERKAALLGTLLRSAIALEAHPSDEVVSAASERVLALLEQARASGIRLLAQLTRPRAPAGVSDSIPDERLPPARGTAP